MTHRTRWSARSRRLPLPLFLLLVCAAVTIGGTCLRAFHGGPGTTGVGGALAGTAGRLLAFLDFFAGVFTLLSLTAAVVCGLAATDRLVLTARQRLAMQSVHRATSVAALGFLVTHIAVKVAEQHAAPLTAVLPFSGGASLAVSLGTVSADLLVLTAVTGALRGRFAGSRRPWLWRVLHGSAYACWPIALAHGLTAGRQAAVWVLWGYGLCAAAVGLALLVRLLGAAGRRNARRRTSGGLRAYRASTRGRTTAGTVEESLSLAAAIRLDGIAPGSLRIDEPATAGSGAGPAPARGPQRHAPQHGPAGPRPQFVGAGPAPRPSAQPQRPSEPLHHPQQGPVHPQQPQHQPQQPQYAHAQGGYSSGYGYPAGPSPWGAEAQGRQHPTPAETPPHGFAVPSDLFAAPYGPAPTTAPPPVAAHGLLDDSGVWGPWNTSGWETPPHGTQVPNIPTSVRGHGG